MMRVRILSVTAVVGLAAVATIAVLTMRSRCERSIGRLGTIIDQSPVSQSVYEAVLRDDADALKAQLRGGMVPPNGTYDSLTLLAHAARSGSVRSIKVLAQAGCMIDAPMAPTLPTTQTALSYACEAQQTNAVLALLECGANIDEGQMSVRPVVLSLGKPVILQAVIARKPSRKSAAVAAKIALAMEDWSSYEALVLYLNRGKRPTSFTRENWLEEATECDCPCGYESLWENAAPGSR